MSTRRSHDVNRITGTHTLFLVISVVGLLRVVGLVDGGVKIRAVQRADTLAAEARRAGGQAIRVPLAITGEPPSPLLALRPPRPRRTCGPTRSRATWFIATASANSAWSSPARLPRCSSG
jgi:hypothetical protein